MLSKKILVRCAFNPNTGEAGEGGYFEFEVSPIYTANSKIARAI